MHISQGYIRRAAWAWFPSMPALASVTACLEQMARSLLYGLSWDLLGLLAYSWLWPPPGSTQAVYTVVIL